MIEKYSFGQPLETGAVVRKIPQSTRPFHLMQLTESSDGIELCCQMQEQDVVYGLGEQVRGINKRGFTYISNATDDPFHLENRHSLYGAHNFFILSRKNGKSFGIFIDDPGRVAFDVGETKIDRLCITMGKDRKAVSGADRDELYRAEMGVRLSAVALGLCMCGRYTGSGKRIS